MISYFTRSVLILLVRTWHLKENVQFWALHQAENADEYAFQLPSYLLNVGGGKRQVEGKEAIKLPSSVKAFTDI